MKTGSVIGIFAVFAQYIYNRPTVASRFVHVWNVRMSNFYGRKLMAKIDGRKLYIWMYFEQLCHAFGGFGQHLFGQYVG